MRIFKSLKSRIIFFSVFIVSFSLLVTSFVISSKIEHYLSNYLENNAHNLLETIKINIESEYKNILFYNKSNIQRRKAELKNHIDIIIGLMEMYQQRIDSGEMSENHAKQLVIDAINNIKFEKGVGYFWINDTQLPCPKMIYHKTLPELNGQILDDVKFNTTYGTNTNLFSEMVESCLKDGAGYVKYSWPKPTETGLTEAQPKISYVKLFKPWNWIIGTGVYIDDIETGTNKKIETVVENLNKTISKQMVSESGYCFIFGEDNYMYVHPYLAGQRGDNLINPSQPTNILDDIKKACHSGDKYMEYNWDRIDDRENYIYPKKVFVTQFTPLEWYICVSVYQYDFQEDIHDLTKTILLITMIFLAGSIILAFLISSSITKPLYRLMTNIQKTTPYGIPKLLNEEKNTAEIETLTQTINRMTISVKESREALKSERDFTLEIIDGSPDIICGLQKDGRIEFINKSGELYTGYSQKELEKIRWWDLIVVSSDQKKKYIINAINSGTQRNLEVILLKKNGQKLTVLWNSTPYSSSTHKNIELIANCIDITDRKIAENKLAFLRNYLSKVINAMSSAIIGIDKDGTITQWNDAAAEKLDIQNLDGLSIYELMSDLGITRNLIDRLIELEQIHTISKRNVLLNNNCLYLEIVIYPLIYDSYKGAVIRLDDITDKVRMEDIMVHTEKMISIGGLAAGMAHEINNPIAGMLQNALVLKNKLSVSMEKNREIASEIGFDLNKLEEYLQRRSVNKHLELIKESGVRAADIVLNMLSFARKSDSKHEMVRIDLLIENTIKILKNDYNINKKYDFQKIIIERNYIENLPEIRCEISKMQQVFMNIMKNGAEAIFKKTDLTNKPLFRINVKVLNNFLRIEFNNNGPTIDVKTKKRIFEPFFTTKPNGEGTGLGLSVSYFIITRHHAGKMWVESDNTEGTTFFIELPLNDEN